jgi:hypothetical protein
VSSKTCSKLDLLPEGRPSTVNNDPERTYECTSNGPANSTDAAERVARGD